MAYVSYGTGKMKMKRKKTFKMIPPLFRLMHIATPGIPEHSVYLLTVPGIVTLRAKCIAYCIDDYQQKNPFQEFKLPDFAKRGSYLILLAF